MSEKVTAMIEEIKGLTVLEQKITIRSVANDANRADMKALAQAMAGAI